MKQRREVVAIVFNQKDPKSVAIHRIELPTPFAIGTVNAFLILEGPQKILVDCGPRYEPAQTALLGALQERGMKPQDVTALVLTHGHVDHVGMAGLFQSQGVPVYSHSEVNTWLNTEGKWVDYRQEFYDRLYQQCGMPDDVRQRALDEYSVYRLLNDQSVVDVSLHDRSVLPCLPRFRIVEVPGHAQAAIALLDEETGDFVAGDQLLPHVSSNALIEPQLGATTGAEAKRTKSLLQYRANFKYLRELGIRTVYPGHGPIFQDANALLDKRLADQKIRKARFLDLLAQHKELTAFDLATAFFPRHREQASLILSETLGYLDWLLEDGRVAVFSASDGTERWTSVDS